MGDNQEVIATRKRMVEKIKQESNGSNKIHVVKKDKWKETHPIEGDISTLKGEYEINVIGRSTIQDETTRVLEGNNAKQLLEVLASIAPLERGAASADTPVLKKITITHCKESDCSPINNLAESLRVKVAEDITVKDSLEYQRDKALNQSTSQQKKQLNAERREQESNAERERSNNEQINIMNWGRYREQKNPTFVETKEIKQERVKQATRIAREKEVIANQAKAEQVKQEIRVAEAAVKSGNRRQDQMTERVQQNEKEKQEVKKQAIKLIIKDIERFKTIPDQVKTRLTKYLEQDSVKFPPKIQEMPNKVAPRSSKQIGISVEQAEVNALKVHLTGLLTEQEMFVHNLRYLFSDKSLATVNNWGDKVVNFWMNFKYLNFSARKSANKLSELQKNINPNSWSSASDLLKEINGQVLAAKVSEIILKVDEDTKRLEEIDAKLKDIDKYSEAMVVKLNEAHTSSDRDKLAARFYANLEKVNEVFDAT
jgi:hypothetical protein